MKVARTVLRGAALGNKCRLLDNSNSVPKQKGIGISTNPSPKLS
ncbi:hypothetical protein VCRA2122O12_330050 [Vibrio crassostreae]|nr:hypothetical protein VCRA2114E5_300002 [Vibrio crassostreae]CAK1997983.1 hypothetical protein VCRA2110O4_320002 [Vibrio crassostreae]CAK2009407.1 hypothetical protein VCRA2110O1_330050 [Vibrio crassostreae]CAK2792268.1 hypothetical protein VCRA2110O3_310051 [Vibrio crassostreae]CAK2806965.1 hypothetical protein VCRA2110O2_320002 [Vibrio crassostreae]